MEVHKQFALREINNKFILVPINSNSYAYNVNLSFAISFRLINKGYTFDDIIEFFKFKFPNKNITEIKNDVIHFKNILNNIVVPKRNLDFENDIRQNALNNSIPIDCSFELTYRCNIRCKHCYVNSVTDFKQLTTNEIFSIIDEIKKEGCLWILFTGGEPLMRKDFREIYIYAKNNGFIVSVFSNGLLVNDNIAKLFRDYPPEILEISIYGVTNETYNSLTGDANGYNKIIETCDLLDYYGVSYKLKAFITKLNYKELDQIENFAKERKVQFRYDTETNRLLDGSVVSNDVALSHKKAIEINLKDNALEKKKIWLNESENRKTLYDNELFYCSAGKSSFFIDPKGNISICSRVREPAYNIKNKTFKEIWGKIKKDREIAVPIDFKCKTCELLAFCKTCPVSNFISDEQRKDEYCNFAYERKKYFERI